MLMAGVFMDESEFFQCGNGRKTFEAEWTACETLRTVNGHIIFRHQEYLKLGANNVVAEEVT